MMTMAVLIVMRVVVLMKSESLTCTSRFIEHAQVMNPILDSIQFAVRECASKTTDYSILDR